MANRGGAHFSLCSLRLKLPVGKGELAWASAAGLTLGGVLRPHGGSVCYKPWGLGRGTMNHRFLGTKSQRIEG